jgi:hypothetical protein
MRNNNPGNIKYVGQAGTTPSSNLDQGDPQAVFATPEAGMSAMYRLLLKKYQGGKVTPNMIVAGKGGWTPGNSQAAANVARYAGIGPNDDIGLTDPGRASAFMRALMLQEHGEASRAYTDQQISAAIGGGGQVAAQPAAPVAPDGPKGQEAYAPPNQYALPATPRHPPSPQVGTGGYVDPSAPTTAPAAPAEAQPTTWWQSLAKNIGKLGPTGGIGNIEPAKGGAAMPQAARIDQGEVPTIDPAANDQQRQQLAMVMQRLNSGRLF